MHAESCGQTPNRRVRRRPWLVLSLLAVVVITIAFSVTAGCDEGCSDAPTETQDDSFTVGDSPKVVVITSNGGIKVNAGSDNEVRVQATLREPDRIDYTVSPVGDTITVEAKARSGGPWTGCMSAEITVTAPARTDVDLKTSNGAIELDAIEGSGKLTTSNGKIVLDNVKGNFEGRTSNGEVDARGVIGEFDLGTSNGRISFHGELTAGGSNRLVTSNGSVDVELLGTPSVSLEATTSNGDITSELPMTDALIEDDRIVGTVGDGEANLYISTSNGDVTIR